MMDQHSRKSGTIVLATDKNGNEIRDWDQRISQESIYKLKPAEVGYQKFSPLNSMEGRSPLRLRRL